MPAAARPGTLHSIWMSPQGRNGLQAVFGPFCALCTAGQTKCVCLQQGWVLCVASLPAFQH